MLSKFSKKVGAIGLCRTMTGIRRTRTLYNSRSVLIQRESQLTKIKKHNCDDIVPLPTELVNYRNKNFYAAGILLVIGVVVALYVKDWKPLMLFILFCAYFVWRGMVVAKAQDQHHKTQFQLSAIIILLVLISVNFEG